MAELLLIAAAIYLFALVSERLSMAPITAPMVFTGFGLLIGHAGLDWFDLDLEGEAVSILVEATLVLVLFSDAVRIDIRALRAESQFPARLLGIGLPGTFALGTVAAFVIFDDFGWAEAALLAAALAPTDAALGQAVVSDGRLPVRLRQGLNVESGLNDGIVVPIVTVTLAIAAAEAGGLSRWGEFVARQIGFGLLCGLVAGVLGGRILRDRALAEQVEGVYQQLATLAIAAGAFAGASLLDGNGFIAAFVAGLAFGAVARSQCQHIQDFTEDEGELLNAITFTVFGAVLAGPALDELTWRIGLYAVLSLTVIRMLPVAIAMLRSGTLVETRLFAGWFGPRGLASILFALLVLEELETPAATTIYLTTTWTILISVVAHGVTASPWAGRLAGRLREMPADQAEMVAAPELPTRRGMV
ncbi:MAG: sodium:proton exchanger [Ilumatobacter sp.]|nr:sodium:proton exchanger [Ilumatobacter sp.]